MIKRVLIMSASALIALGLTTFVASPAAYASTACTGKGCDGLDPTQSNHNGNTCSSSATSSLTQPALGGTIELRYGPNCGTNWNRFTPGDNDSYQIWVTRNSDGVWAGTGLYHTYQFSNANGVAHYSDQVYRTGAGGTSVCVDDLTFGARACFTA